MSTDRLQLARDRLNIYYQAEMAVLTSQEYSIGPRSMKRADLGEIRSAISALENQVQRLEAQQNGDTSSRVRRIVIRDT